MAGHHAKHRKLGLALFALFVTIAGPLLYRALMGNPWVRSSGAPAFVLMALGTMLGIRAIAQDRRLLVRGIGALSPLLTVLFTYIFVWGLALPAAPHLDELADAPMFTLPDEEGRPVSLAEVTAEGPALLVFYRGYW